MSDMSIPGVKSKYDTEKMIEDLMKVERIPRDKAAEELKAYEVSKTVWLDVNMRLSAVRESARILFSFRNPFSERVAKSSNEDALTGTATREAVEQTKSILVKQTADADRFLSDRLPKDTKVPAGDYAFAVGDKTVSLKYGGGSLADFSDALTRKGKDVVRAQVIPVTSDTLTIVVESLKTGSKNRLSFRADAEPWAVSVGLIEKTSSSRREIPVSESSIKPLEKPLDRTLVTVRDGTLVVAPGGEARLPLQPPVQSAGLVLEYRVRAKSRPDDGGIPQAPAGPDIPPTGSVTYKGVTIQSSPSAADLPEWKPPEIPPRVDDPNVFSLMDGSGRSVPLPPVSDSESFVTVTVRLADYARDFSGIAARNRNTHREVEVRDIRVFDPNESGGFKPKNPIGTARDAIVVMDGIEVVREGNDIPDLIPGVTIHLHEQADKPVKLRIEPDRETVKTSIIEMIGNYNRIMAEINVLTRDDPKVLEEIAYLTDDEKTKYKDRQGMFQGDLTLSQLRSSLQKTMMDAYPTGSGQALLAQTGISTNASNQGGGYEPSKLRGYLEIDEKALEAALLNDFVRVRELFAFDTDGDLISDAGVAFRLDATIKPYVETGGIISAKTRTLDSRMTEQKRRIEDMDKQLARKEDELKRKYGLMEGALNQMESASTAIENFGNQNSK
ncbi:MAG: flagellar filament capping protein FliD [Spirochaetes bacterium]|nr:flagellar filament capping protein FliD [Spirochaetota bacterium]